MKIRNKKNIFSFVIIFIFFLVGYHFWTAVNFDNIKYVKIAGQNIKVDLALTGERQMQGLSGLSDLAEDHGLLFVFEKPGKYYFWMKGMNFPIDIIWITEEMKVIYIKKNAPPNSYPETFGPDANTKYVLEIGFGFSDKNNLKVGDSVLFDYQ